MATVGTAGTTWFSNLREAHREARAVHIAFGLAPQGAGEMMEMMAGASSFGTASGWLKQNIYPLVN